MIQPHRSPTAVLAVLACWVLLLLQSPCQGQPNPVYGGWQRGLPKGAAALNPAWDEQP